MSRSVIEATKKVDEYSESLRQGYVKIGPDELLALNHASHLVETSARKSDDISAEVEKLALQDELANVKAQLARAQESLAAKDVIASAEDAIASAGVELVHSSQHLASIAFSAVALAMTVGGQDTRHWREADVTEAEIIRDALLRVRNAKTVELPVAFRQTSAQSDVDAANRVKEAGRGEK
jgi:hypothetical protein